MSKDNLASVSELSDSPSGIEKSPYYVLAAFAVMLIGLIVLFGSFLFSGKMLYGSDMISAGLFHRTFLVEHFQETGAIPQWNPYAYGGMPYVDAFHGDIFYPLSVLKFLIPLYYHLGLVLVLHIFFAGVFMYLAGRQFKLGKTAALFAAASYMFAPCLVSLVASGHDGKIYSSALFPLVMLFLDKAFESKPFLNLTLMGIILGCIILSPQPETSYFTLWAVALYSLYKLTVLWLHSGSVRATIKPGLLIAYAVIIALLLSAIQFYPGYVYSTKSSVRVYRENSWSWATSWSMHEEEAFSQLIPEFCGTSFPRLTHPEIETFQSSYWGKNYFKADSDAVGVSAIFLALLSVFLVRRKETYFFAALAIFAFVYALGATTPIFKVFFHLIPKVDTLRAPSKIIFLFSFSISLLAGMTVESIIKRRNSVSPKPGKWMSFYLLAFPTLLLAVGLLFTFAGNEAITAWISVFFPDAQTITTGEENNKLVMALQNIPEIAHGASMALLAVAFTAFLIWFYLKKNSPVFLITLLFVIPLIDGTRFNRRFVRLSEPKEHFEPNDLTRFLSSQSGEFRVLNRSHDLPRSLLPQHGIELVTGYHGNQLRWYDDLLGGPHFKNRSNPRYLNLVGTRYLVIPAKAQLKEDYFGEIPARPVSYYGWDQIVRNDNAFDRIFLVNKYRVFTHRLLIPNAIMEGDEDLRKVVFLEKMPGISIPPDSIEQDSVWTISRGADSVTIGVHCTSNRLLILMDNYYDSWRATADGKPVEVLRAYSSFRAVAVPAGTKEVSFKYKSNRYAIGKGITTATSVYLLIVFCFYFWNSRAGKKKSET